MEGAYFLKEIDPRRRANEGQYLPNVDLLSLCVWGVVN